MRTRSSPLRRSTITPRGSDRSRSRRTCFDSGAIRRVKGAELCVAGAADTAVGAVSAAGAVRWSPQHPVALPLDRQGLMPVTRFGRLPRLVQSHRQTQGVTRLLMLCANVLVLPLMHDSTSGDASAYRADCTSRIRQAVERFKRARLIRARVRCCALGASQSNGSASLNLRLRHQQRTKIADPLQAYSDRPHPTPDDSSPQLHDKRLSIGKLALREALRRH